MARYQFPLLQTPKEFNVNSPGIYPGVHSETARITPTMMIVGWRGLRVGVIIPVKAGH